MSAGFDRLASKSVHQTLSEEESDELTSAMCDPDAWSRAADIYGLSRILAGTSEDALVEALPFGSLVIKNPHVADWFSVFCGVPGGMTAVRSALAGATPVEAFVRGVDEIACGGKKAHDCADDKTFVAAASLCSGVIYSVRTHALLRFFGIAADAPHSGSTTSR
jgi:hypothetical protein